MKHINNIVLKHKNSTIYGYLSDRLLDQITWYDKKSVELKKKHKYNWISYVIWLIVSLNMALISIDFVYHNQIISGIMIFLALFIPFIYENKLLKKQSFNIHKKYRETCEALQRELIFFDNKTGLYDIDDENKINKILVERCELLMKEEHNFWSKNYKYKGGKENE